MASGGEVHNDDDLYAPLGYHFFALLPATHLLFAECNSQNAFVPLYNHLKNNIINTHSACYKSFSESRITSQS